MKLNLSSKFAILTLVLMTLSVMNIAVAQDSAQLKAGAQQLTAADITKMLTGNTLAGKSNDGEWFFYYDKDGTFRGKATNGTYKGTWNLAGDKLCVHFADGDTWGCRVVMVNPKYNRLFFVKEDGSTGNGGGTVIAGNPKGL